MSFRPAPHSHLQKLLRLCRVLKVITRFIASSSPVIYWYIATVGAPDTTTSHDNIPTKLHEEEQNIHTSDHGEEQNDPTSEHLNKQSDDGDRTQGYEYSETWDTSSWTISLVSVYFPLYFFVGVAAFSNFLPWT